MSNVKCAARHAVPLPDGRLIPPGRVAAGVDLAHPEVRTYLDTGALIALETVDVPTAKVADVLAWVDDDPERAAVALAAENARPERDQRSTLVVELERLAGTTTDTPED